MVDLMVDIVANMLDNRGSSNGNWGSVGISNWSSMGNSNWGSNSMSSSIDSTYKTMSKKTMTVGTGNETSISI